MIVADALDDNVEEMVLLLEAPLLLMPMVDS